MRCSGGCFGGSSKPWRAGGGFTWTDAAWSIRCIRNMAAPRAGSGFRETRQTVCTGVEMFKKQLDEGLAGDNAGLLLRGIAKEDVERGMVLAKPGSITPHTEFKGEVYVLSKEEGGRHTPF